MRDKFLSFTSIPQETVLTVNLNVSSREGATVIIVTHDPTVASMTSVYEMRDGLIIMEHVNQSAFAGTKIH